MRKKILAFAILITLLFNNGAVSAWAESDVKDYVEAEVAGEAAAESETQSVSDSENNEIQEDIPGNQDNSDKHDEQTEAGETMTEIESTASGMEQPEPSGQEPDSSEDQGEASQEDIPVASPEDVIELDDYIREQYGEEYVSQTNESNGSDEGFIVDLAISSKSHFWQAEDARDALKNHGYTIDGCNTNAGIGNGGDYVYLGWKYTNDLQSNIGSVMTGILICKDDDPASFRYNGKTYYPLSTRFRDSNFNLNQGNTGRKLYIYYTRDGAKEGDPVITTRNFGVSIGEPADALMAEGYDHGVINRNQNLSERGGGDDVYLAYNYHKHDLVITAYEDGHMNKCKNCSFHKQMEQHVCEYVSISDSQHEGTCKVCHQKIQESHTDSDEDGLCDGCKTPVEAKITIETPGRTTEVGAYKKFTAAWNDAIANKTDCSIILLKDISLTSDHIEQDAQHLTPLDNGKTITIKNAAGQAQAKLTVKGDAFNNFSEVFYVTKGELKISTGIVIDGGISFNSVIKASSAAAKINMDSAEIFVRGNLNKNLSFITGDQSACLELPKVTLEFTGSRGSGPYSIYGIHALNGSTADIALGTITNCDQAFHLNNAKLNIHEGHYQDKTVIYAESGENNEILIQGGEFTGTDGYCLDSNGAKVSIEFGKFNGSLRVSANQKITSVLAQGRYAAEIDSSNNIIRHIPYAELEMVGNTITFAKRTMIIECTAHNYTGAIYYSRLSHKGICDYCRSGTLLRHQYNDQGFCPICKTEKEIVLVTNAGSYEYYDSLEDAIKEIRARTDVTLVATRDIQAVDPFRMLAKEADTEKKRITFDLKGFNLSLLDNGAGVLLDGCELTIQNGTCDVIAGHGFSLAQSKLSIHNCSMNVSGGEVEIKDSHLTVGKDGEMKASFDMNGAGVFELTDNSKITALESLTIEAGQQMIMAEQSTYTITENTSDQGIFVKKDGSLTLKDEALIDVKPDDLQYGVLYEEGAIISFAGGCIRKEDSSAIECKNSNRPKVIDFLVPGYAYYDLDSGKELDEKSIEDEMIYFSFVVRPHKTHTYKYFDMGDGKHNAVCSLCKMDGGISPHVGRRDIDRCAKCNAPYVCTHEFGPSGLCIYCYRQAVASVTIDGVKSYYFSFQDAWKQAKGNKAIIHTYIDIDLKDQSLVVDDKDDITFETRNIRDDQDSLFLVNGGKLIISDGSFRSRDNSTSAVVVNDGELIINGGEIDSAVVINGGKVTADGGNFRSVHPITVKGGTLTITGGSFHAEAEALLVQSGSVTLRGGSFYTQNRRSSTIQVMRDRNVRDLLPTGYYYAVSGKNTPAVIDNTQPWHIRGQITVKQHTDHSGYWKEGVCSVCNYICSHPSFIGNQCSVCGMKFESKIAVLYKEGDNSKREGFENLQEALNFACQHVGSEVIVSEDIPAEATDKTSYTIPDNSIPVDSPIDFTINLGKNTIGTKLSINSAKVTIKGDGGGISVPREQALHIDKNADVHVENCCFRTEDSKYAAISVTDSKAAYLKNIHANGGYALDASNVMDTVTLDGGYYCTASGDKDSALQAVAFISTAGIIRGCTITATAEKAAALYLYRCEHVVIEDTRLLVDDTATGVNSIRIPDRGSSETELTIGQGSGIYEVASGKNITDDYSAGGKISESVDKSVYIGKAFPDKKAQIIGYEPLADIEFSASTAIDDILARIPSEANAVTLYYPDNKVKVKVAFDKEEIRKAIQKVYDQEKKTMARGVDRPRIKKIDIYAKGIVSGWPEDIATVLEDTINLRLCVVVQKYSVSIDGGQTSQEYFIGDTVELHADGHTHGKVFRCWEILEGSVNIDLSLPNTSFIMPPENLIINAVYEDQLDLVTEKAETCTKPGNKAYYICDCGQWFWSPEDVKADKPIADHNDVVIPATGHVDKDKDGRCDICSAHTGENAGDGSGDQKNQKPMSPNRMNGASTGDQSNVGEWFALLVISSLALCVIIYRRKSRRR